MKHAKPVAVLASFAQPERLVAVWADLPRVAGAEAAARAEVRSSTPLPHAVSTVVSPGRGPGFAILLCSIFGALLGGGTALFLVLGTEAMWNFSVGGMGGVAGPPTGILTYEGAALGLVLCTVAGVLVFGGLLRRPPQHEALDHELAAGRVLVRVEAAGDDTSGLERLFRDHGAVAVATTGGARHGAGGDEGGASTEPP
ncbi:MAG TPA: quinol:electron acceptor oxidoreductase subunit ActD [Gemmatimonadales bacterium]|nr:quinol:electron acceptor oxidoreductase subunit ActD [Gemmatimonadales bacterium]